MVPFRRVRLLGGLYLGWAHDWQDDASAPSVVNYPFSEHAALATDLVRMVDGGVNPPLLGLRSDLRGAWSQGNKETQTAGTFAIVDLYVFMTMTAQQPVPGGEHSRGITLRGGWLREHLVYDTVYDDPSWYGFYRGVRPFAPTFGDPKGSTLMADGMARYAIDENSFPGVGLEINMRKSLPIDAAHVPALAANARIDYLMPSPLVTHESRLIEYPVDPDPYLERRWRSAAARHSSSAPSVSTKANIGLQNKDRSVAAVGGLVGRVALGEESLTLSGENWDYQQHILSAFLSVRWLPVSLVVQGCFRRGAYATIEPTTGERRSRVTADKLGLVRLSLRPLQVLAIRVPEEWRSTLNVYFDATWGRVAPFDTDDGDPAGQPRQRDSFAGGISSIMPLHPLTDDAGETSLALVLDLQVLFADGVPVFAGMAGIRLAPRYLKSR